MFAFEVKDMTCGHCAATITRALKSVDAGAQVQVDLAAQRVTVDAAAADAAALLAAIHDAGYTPVAVGVGV
jgi:copper chaperone